MAKGEEIKRLIGNFGRPREFRAAAQRIIDDAHRKGQTQLASSLKKVLDANVTDFSVPVPVAGGASWGGCP